MRFTNYIWDFDGTLFDTYPRMRAAFAGALRLQGCERSADEIMAAIKRSVRSAAESYPEAFRLDKGRLSADYRAIEHAMPIETIIPYDGTDGFLRAVIAQGGRHFLYTHRDFTALEALRRCGLEDCFSGAVTADDRFPAKPAPDALLRLMSTYALVPASTVMLGDRDIDLEAAKNAGIAGCLVDPEHFYDAYPASLRCESIDGLYSLMVVARR